MMGRSRREPGGPQQRRCINAVESAIARRYSWLTYEHRKLLPKPEGKKYQDKPSDSDANPEVCGYHAEFTITALATLYPSTRN